MTTSCADLIEMVLLSGIERDAVLAALIDDLDFFGADRVVEANQMSAARFDQAQVILPIRIGFWRLVLAIPECPEHIRPA